MRFDVFSNNKNSKSEQAHNVDTNDEIDDIEIITESLFVLSSDDPFPNTVETLLNHDTIIGWEDLSIDAQNAVRLQYPTIESSTSESKYNNEVYTTDCVAILCNSSEGTGSSENKTPKQRKDSSPNASDIFIRLRGSLAYML